MPFSRTCSRGRDDQREPPRVLPFSVERHELVLAGTVAGIEQKDPPPLLVDADDDLVVRQRPVARVSLNEADEDGPIRPNLVDEVYPVAADEKRAKPSLPRELAKAAGSDTP